MRRPDAAAGRAACGGNPGRANLPGRRLRMMEQAHRHKTGEKADRSGDEAERQQRKGDENRIGRTCHTCDLTFGHLVSPGLVMPALTSQNHAARYPCKPCEASLQVKKTTSASGVTCAEWMTFAGM